MSPVLRSQICKHLQYIIARTRIEPAAREKRFRLRGVRIVCQHAVTAETRRAAYENGAFRARGKWLDSNRVENGNFRADRDT